MWGNQGINGDVESGERRPLLAQGGGAPASQPFGTQSSRAVNDVVQTITSLVNQLKELEKTVEILGTPRETASVRSSALQQKTRIEASFKEAQQALVSARSILDPARYNKIDADLRKVSSYATNIFSRLSEKQRISGSFSTDTRDSSWESQSQQMQQQQYQPQPQRQSQNVIQLMEQEDVDQKILQEHREGIMQIAEDLVVLKELFTDVQQLVGEQGEQLVKVETNTTEANVATYEAVQELKEASSLTDNLRKRKLYIYFCIFVTVLLVAIIVTIVEVIKHK